MLRHLRKKYAIFKYYSIFVYIYYEFLCQKKKYFNRLISRYKTENGFISSYIQESQTEINKNNIGKEDISKQETKLQEAKTIDENIQNNNKKSESGKEPIPNQSSNAISTAETNGIDNEDSINLTIGEDEENLLAEEV